jgi:preprotein translocase subunit YajC
LSIAQLRIVQWLADGAATQSHAPTQDVPFWANPQNVFLLVIFAMLMFFVFSSSKAKRNEQKQRDDMLKNMKRGDRVMTAGGILGSVVDVRDNEVVLKVDEGSNTKIKFSRDAIKRVLTDDDATATGTK